MPIGGGIVMPELWNEKEIILPNNFKVRYFYDEEIDLSGIYLQYYTRINQQTGEKEWHYVYYEGNEEKFSYSKDSDGYLPNNTVITFDDGASAHTTTKTVALTVLDRYDTKIVSCVANDTPIVIPNNVPQVGVFTKDCIVSMNLNVYSKRYGSIFRQISYPDDVVENTTYFSFSPDFLSFSNATNPLEEHNIALGATYTETSGGSVSAVYQSSNTYPVLIVYRHQTALKIEGTDSNNYYNGRTNIFIAPVGLTFKEVFNDGSEQVTNGSIEYHLTENDLSPLTSGSSVLTGNPDYVWVYVTILDTANVERTIKQKYTVNYVPDAISDVEIANEEVEFILGNTLASQKDNFVIRATYVSGYVDNDFTDYEFDNTNEIIEPLESDISIKIGSFHETLDHTKLTYTNPTLKSLRFTNLGSTALSNKIEAFDFTKTKVIASFNNATYEKEYSFGRVGVGLADYFEISSKYRGTNNPVFSPEDLDNYNKTNELNITMTEGYTDIIVTFTVISPFDNTDTLSTDVNFTIFDIINITGISVDSPEINYKVGDVFPRDDDDTLITIYWEQEISGNNAFLRKQIPLKSGFGSLNIQPYQETLRNVNYSKTIKISSVLNSSVYTTYDIQVKPRELLEEDATIVLHAEYDQFAKVLYLKDNTNKIYGYIENIFDDTKNARVVLYDDYLSPISGMANIEVTFPSYHEGEADKINNCHFGCLFGANNAVNRLFVSGNREIGNADWHTAELNLTDYEGEIEMTNGNFSYIPSESVMYYGETDNAICGYEIVSNDKLLVLKSKSDKEKTVYFRTPTLLKALDSSGNEQTDINGETLVQEEFSLVKGNNSVAGISPKSILNLNGDLLFVSSDNEVVGLDLVGIVGDNQRYANSRSKAIDKKLHELDLSDCTFWTNNKYAFLSIKGYGLFVTHFEARTESQYEWWYLTSNNPTTFIEIDDEIYIGSDDGSFSKLFNGTWRDVKKLFIREDQTVLINIYPQSEKIGVDNSIISQMDTNVSYKFRSIEEDDYRQNVYYKIATIRQKVMVDNEWVIPEDTDILIDGDHNCLEVVGDFKRKERVLKDIGDNNIYYLNYIEEDLSAGETIKIDCDNTIVDNEFLMCFGSKFKLVKLLESENQNDYDGERYRFRLEKLVNGQWVTTQVGRLHNARLCMKLVNDVDIVDLDKENNEFKLKENGEYIDIVQYGEQSTQRIARAEIREYRNVDALYITAPLLANSLNTFKTIWQVTMTNDTDIDSALQVCIASNKVPYSSTKQLETAGRLGVDLNAFSFFVVDYDKVVVPRTYTINRTLPMQKFLCFGFRNKSGYNAVLSEMAVTYTLPFPSYGSD